MPNNDQQLQPGIGRLEGVTVCVNYSDFLDVTLQHNLHHFDELVVVTTHEDKATQYVCQKHGVICVPTDCMTENGDSFSKGQGINLGLAYLKHNGYILHFDSDIILPDRFRTMLDKARIKKDCIYGADRLNVIGRDEYNRVVKSNEFKRQFHHRFLVSTPPNLELGSRLLHNEYGYAPIGYFQLWHSSANRRYPYNAGSAEHSDLMFALQWKVNKRILLPNVICYHLESEKAKMGANWKGRTTKRF